MFASFLVGYFRSTSIVEKEDVNKDRPDSECLWALGKSLNRGDSYLSWKWALWAARRVLKQIFNLPFKEDT